PRTAATTTTTSTWACGRRDHELHACTREGVRRPVEVVRHPHVTGRGGRRDRQPPGRARGPVHEGEQAARRPVVRRRGDPPAEGPAPLAVPVELLEPVHHGEVRRGP